MQRDCFRNPVNNRNTPYRDVTKNLALHISNPNPIMGHTVYLCRADMTAQVAIISQVGPDPTTS